MNRAARWLIALVAVFALQAHAAVVAEPPVATKHFLWEVASLTNRIYLYGTIHAGRKDWFPLDSAVENAFNDSATLVVEADITDEVAMQRATPAMLLAPPDTLRNHVDAADYGRFVKLLPRYGLTETQVAPFKPFMAVSLLVFGEWARNGYLPQYGIDAYLLKRAKAELKPVAELEGVEAQTKLMEMDEAEAQKLFAGTIKALEDGLTNDQINGMVDAWRGGDPGKLLGIARKYNETIPGAREFEERLIWSRHDGMLRKIEGYLNDSRERHFVAVGALHLAGERGLVELLRKRGYRVTQK